MPFYEREDAILSLLRTGDVISVEDLAAKLFISLPTVRRDLNQLAKKGLIVRTHGGAALLKKAADERIPFALREQEHDHAKNVMAQKALPWIKDGFTIMLDGSTSAFAIVSHLASFQNLIVITSSAKASLALGQMGIRNVCTGGHMILRSFSYAGEDAIRTVLHYNADIFFFSCRGLSADGYLTDNSIEENRLRQVMMQRSRKSVLLCDQSKFEKTYLHNLCHISAVDEILSDGEIPSSILAMKNGVDAKEKRFFDK